MLFTCSESALGEREGKPSRSKRNPQADDLREFDLKQYVNIYQE